MLKSLVIVVLVGVLVCAIVGLGTGDSPAPEREKSIPAMVCPMSAEDIASLELGRKVLAVRKAIQNPNAPNAMNAVTDLGLDQRYYVMVRGWLSYQLQGDMSIQDANKQRTRDEVNQRIRFLKKAIGAIDLE